MQIYLIRNKINQKCYVGQTIWDFKTRYSGGRWDKFSHNKYLKYSAAKYGIENFEIKILENGNFTIDELTQLEDKYIKEYNALIPNGYNSKEAGKRGRNYYNHKEYELIDKNGNIYKVINLSQFCKKSNLNYGAMLNMVSGISYSSQGYALSSTPIEKIINPDEIWEMEKISTKEIFKVTRKDANIFCKQNNINIDSFFQLTRKQIWVSKGWKLKETTLDNDKIREKTTKYENIKLTNKDGEEIVINNVYKYCKENNIPRQDIYELISGRAIERHGLKLSSMGNVKEQRLMRMGLILKFKNIFTNEIIEIKNVSDFCRKKNLNIDVMHSMIRGTIKQYMGYTLPGRDLSNYKFPKKIIYIKMINNNGREVEGKNPIEIQNKYGIMSSQAIREMINGKRKIVRGWSIKNVKYLNNYYPEINL
jgi:hypothetical protein